MTTSLIQIPDDQNTDTGVVRLVAPGEAGLIERFTYLVCESAGREFFLQIATANRNLSRFSPEPFKTVSLAAYLALLEETGYTRSEIPSFYYVSRIGNKSYQDRTSGSPESLQI